MRELETVFFVVVYEPAAGEIALWIGEVVSILANVFAKKNADKEKEKQRNEHDCLSNGAKKDEGKKKRINEEKNR